jgi:hypothetical protein
MAITYGTLFFDKWRDVAPEMLKAAWAEELAGFADRPDAIKYALDLMLESKFPPSLPEFLADCRRAPAPVVRQIEHKLSPEEIAHNKARLKLIAENLYRSKAA